MSMMIAGLGTALPPHQISQADAAQIVKQYSCVTAAQERLFETLYRRAGVSGRGSVVLDNSEGPLEIRQSFYTSSSSPTTLDRMRKYEAESSPLAVAASRAALRDAGVEPDRVTHLITVSCSGFCAPGFDIGLVKQLPLPSRVARTHIGFMGCHGALNGLRVARAFVEADPSACVLLCALELCSLHQQYGWDADKVVASALFADGAAAVVALAPEAARTKRYEVVSSGSVVIEDSEDAMSWRIGNHGFEMTLSPRVPELISQHLRPWLEHWLASFHLDLAAIRSWAIHPGGPRILSAVIEAAGLREEAIETSQQVLADHGNMSSPTILFILDRLSRSGHCGPCLALAFGPGLTAEAALLI
ncbi:MAG TPA: type III polyketide synthase [Isosphaeraceae bacterium]|nr:type III polyketide synthase [Isosphaeraceae bacterium]